MLDPTSWKIRRPVAPVVAVVALVLASVARDEDDYCGLAPRRRWGRLANRSTWTRMLCSAREPTEVACMGRVR